MKRKRVFTFLFFLAIGLIIVDGYQDAAGHHNKVGQASMCQTNCSSHMAMPSVSSIPVVQQHQPVNIDEPVVKALSIGCSIFHPPKALA